MGDECKPETDCKMQREKGLNRHFARSKILAFAPSD
jgi:hypothetical protein